jgi:hypothetical protein
MAAVGELGRDDLVSRLIGFDREIGLRFPERRFELLIVGGGALALLGVLDRPTTDIDVLGAPSDLHELMARYDINGRAVSYEQNFPFNRDDRRERIAIPTENVMCYVASLEDLVASKLCSSREQDSWDLREPALLERLDWDTLSAVAEEMPQNCLNDRVLADFRHNYDRFVEECGPCGR